MPPFSLPQPVIWQSQRPRPPGLGLLGRVIALSVAAGLALVLGIAAWLTPEARGYGTHRQLGIPPCTFNEVTGVVCPSCGMTTSFCHFVRGQWLSAYRANPLGLLLAAGSLAAIPWLLLSVWRGRLLGVNNGEVWTARIVGVLLILLFAAWSLRLAGQWWTEGTIVSPRPPVVLTPAGDDADAN